MVMIALDPHPDSHTVAAFDEDEMVLASLAVANNAEGLLKLHQFALPFPDHHWAVEGVANRFILPFVHELLEHGEVVHHISPNLTSQYRGRLIREKNDVVDAQNAARALMEGYANQHMATSMGGHNLVHTSP